jgi:osmotically-inducible protein OsmY
MDRNEYRGRDDRSLDSDWHTREFTRQMYGPDREERRFRDQPSSRDRSDTRDRRDRDDRSHYGRQDFRDSSYGTPANAGWQESDSPRQGSQGYGRYPDRPRQYGIQGGGYGVYDIGGQGAQGYSRLSNGTYDDMDIGYGERHWGAGEYRGEGRRHERTFVERVGEAVSETVGKFFGKGPKGYKRSDARIQEDVSEALYIHRDIDATDIEIEVKDGEVTMTGTVDSRRTKRLCEDVVERVAGVKDVINHLRAKQFSELSDTTDKMGYPDRSSEDENLRH